MLLIKGWWGAGRREERGDGVANLSRKRVEDDVDGGESYAVYCFRYSMLGWAMLGCHGERKRGKLDGLMGSGAGHGVGC